MTRRRSTELYDSDVDPAVALARVPPRPTRSDAILVLVLMLWAIGEHLLLEGRAGLVEGSLFAVGVTAPLLWRRQHPVWVLGTVAAVVVVRGLTAPVAEHGGAPFPSLLVLTFSLAVHVRPVSQSAGLAVVPGLLMTLLSWLGYYGDFSAFSVLLLVFFVGGAWALGRTVLRSADRVLAEQTRSVEVTRQALDEERARIARELHDVVAHAVSIIAVQAGAAEALVDKNPVAAKAHLAAVRRTSREALAEMRHLLEVLRDGEASYVPQPSLSSLPDLVAEVSSAGTPVELHVGPEVPELPAGVELCVYRVVQEALTNVRKHAPGASTTVRVSRQDHEIHVHVHNSAGGTAPDPGTGGQGLAGMAERVRLYGGHVDARPCDDGFLVDARIPLGVPA